MADRRYIKGQRNLAALPRSKRLREAGMRTGGGSFISTGGGTVDMDVISELITTICANRYLSRIDKDTAKELITFMAGFQAGAFEQGKSGAEVDAQGNGELNSLIVRSLFKAASAIIGGNTQTGTLEVGNYDKGLSGAFIDSVGNAEFNALRIRLKALIHELDVEGDSTFAGELSSPDFVSGFIGGKGWALMKKEVLNALGIPETKYTLEVDDLVVRNSMRVYAMLAAQMLGENDNRVFSGMLEVDHYDPDTGRVWLDTQGGKLYNPFQPGDYIMVRQYNGMPSEANAYYVTKAYELIITAAGIGILDDGEERLDWVEFRSFSTSMSVPNPTELITKGDTFVRVDHESNPDRKGIIQIMSVGNDTPYMDVVYGMKTDPENSLKGRLGNLKGIHHKLFGWLQGFGEYLTNLYAVGDFRLRRTGDSIDAQIEMLKSNFATHYSSLTYNITEEDNYLHNASFSQMMEGWEREDEAKFISQNGEAMLMNGNLYIDDGCRAFVEIVDGAPVLRLKKNGIRQKNALIRKPGTHREYAVDASGVTTAYKDVKDKLYITLVFVAETSGTLSIGFQGAGHETDSFPSPIQVITESSTQTQTMQWSGTWDGKGDFVLSYTGDMYVKKLAVTDRALDDFRQEMSTRIQQTDSNILITGQRIDRAEGSVTNLGIELDARVGEINAHVTQVQEGLQQEIRETGMQMSALETRIYANEGTVDNLGNRMTAAEASISVNAREIEQTVKKGDIISSINQSAEEIKISADKIQLAGNVNINNVFHVNDDGTIGFNGVVDGVIRFSSSYSGVFSEAQLYCLPEDPGRVLNISLGRGAEHIGKVIRIYNNAPFGSYTHQVLGEIFDYTEDWLFVKKMTTYSLGPQESIEMTCFRMAEGTAGWIMTNRLSYQNFRLTGTQGRFPLAFAMGHFVWESGDSVKLEGRFYDGTPISQKMTPSRQSTGRYDITFTSGTLPANYMVFLQARSGNSDRTTLNKATLYESSSTKIHVETSDDASRNDGSFDFAIFDLTNWDYPTNT